MIRMSSSLSISILATSSKPFGIEAFDPILKDLWEVLIKSKGRIFASYLKAMGNIIPLMKKEHAGEYSQMILRLLVKEFSSPEDEMKKIVLKVLNEAF